MASTVAPEKQDHSPGRLRPDLPLEYRPAKESRSCRSRLFPRSPNLSVSVRPHSGGPRVLHQNTTRAAETSPLTQADHRVSLDSRRSSPDQARKRAVLTRHASRTSSIPNIEREGLQDSGQPDRASSASTHSFGSKVRAGSIDEQIRPGRDCVPCVMFFFPQPTAEIVVSCATSQRYWVTSDNARRSGPGHPAARPSCPSAHCR